VAAKNLDLALFRTMHRIRAFEETALAAHAAGEVPGVLHVSIGQEAVAAGICAALGNNDLITSNHRGHGHALAKGADARRMMAELLGRAPGFCEGRGGSMHIADFSVGMLGANGVVAGGIPIAVGAAMGLRLRKSNAVVACFFGDGAVNRGPFLEGLNWAALYRLPVLFVCEDNGVAAFTATSAATAGPGAAARAAACGVPAETLDGNDAPAIADAAIRAVAAMRAGGGPRFLHCRTYRLRGHTMSDAAAWRDQAEVAAAEAREPIGRLAASLADQGVTGGFLAAVREEATQEMQQARAFAVSAPWPDAAIALGEVQGLGAPA
jgi:pyruvate dehydrogenase E1 component alpha subunit